MINTTDQNLISSSAGTSCYHLTGNPKNHVKSGRVNQGSTGEKGLLVISPATPLQTPGLLISMSNLNSNFWPIPRLTLFIWPSQDRDVIVTIEPGSFEGLFLKRGVFHSHGCQVLAQRGLMLKRKLICDSLSNIIFALQNKELWGN